MSKVIICEFPWQVDLIKDSLSGDEAIIAFNASTSYALERKEIPFSDVRQYYSHEYLWREYPRFTDRVLGVADRLNEIIWEMDTRFNEEQLKVSDLFSYPLKVLIDQIIYKIVVSRQILRTHALVKNLVCLELRTPTVDDSFYITEDFSLGSWIFDLLKVEFGYKMEFMDYPNSTPVSSERSSIAFKQSVKSFISDWVRTVKPTASLFRRSEICILSVDCDEIGVLKGSLRKNGIAVEAYSGTNFKPAVPSYAYADDILKTVRCDHKIRDRLVFDGVDSFDLVFPAFEKFVKRLGYILKLYREAKHFFRRENIDGVFVQSLASFHPSSIFLAHLCEMHGIPLICWMHGGYGANYSLPGYDVTDFRLGRRHFVYGEAVVNLLNSEKCVLKQLEVSGHKLYVGGTPYFEKMYLPYIRPNNKKKKVLLTIGSQWKYNRFYFGYNRPYAEFCSWEQHRAIIKLFIKHQHQYEFIIKDYPNPAVNTRDLWVSLLVDLEGDKIKVITDEEPYDRVLIRSDLCIFTWVSTTFMQSLFTDADIFLLDDGDLTEEAKHLLERCIEFSSNANDLLIRLDRYLANGKFYVQDKKPLRDFFIDYSNKSKRGEIISRLVREIVGEDC